MKEQQLVCCPYCSKKLERSWNETPSGYPDMEYQSCIQHGVVSTYKWNAFFFPHDVRTDVVIFRYPREEKIKGYEITLSYRSDFEKILNKEPHNIDWENHEIYDRAVYFKINLLKRCKTFVNFEKYYISIKKSKKPSS